MSDTKKILFILLCCFVILIQTVCLFVTYQIAEPIRTYNEKYYTEPTVQVKFCPYCGQIVKEQSNE